MLDQQMTSALRAAFASAPVPASATAVTPEIASSCDVLVKRGSPNCTLVALTNIAGAAADPSIQPQFLSQKAGGVDFRSLYKRTTKPALLDEAARLSIPYAPSADPYVSNPFREPEVNQEWVDRRNNRLSGAEELRLILQYVAEEPARATEVLALLASAVHEQLSSSQIHYSIPPRLTTSFVSEALTDWMRFTSGGKRLQIVAVSLLRFAGEHVVGAWDHVDSLHVNDPRPFDALCTKRGNAVALAECKDTTVTADHVSQLAREMQQQGANRGYIFARSDHLTSEATAIADRIRDRSIYGYRIDILDVIDAVSTWLPFLDQNDQVLPSFMRTLTSELDEHGLLEDRRALANILERLAAP
jgi:hypothetical protein